MSKFKIGDRVVAKPNKYYTITTNGWEGVVIAVHPEIGKIDVRGKGCLGADNVNFRNLFGKCFYLKDDRKEEHEQNWKVVIIPDGDATRIDLYENGKKVKGACVRRFHKDEYNRQIAVEEAVKKLFSEEPKGFTGKAVYTGSTGLLNEGFTIGKIYKFENGETVDDDGDIRPSRAVPEHLKENWLKNFIKVVE